MVKVFDNFIKFIDFFIPEDKLEQMHYSDKQRSRMLILSGIFGTIVPLILIFSLKNIPNFYIYNFVALWVLSLFNFSSFRLFRLTSKQVGAVATLGLSLILSSFIMQNDIIFSGTKLWFPTAIMMAFFTVGYRWGLLNLIILLGATLYNHYHFFPRGLRPPVYWDEFELLRNIRIDSTLSLIFNAAMISFFLFTKEKADDEILESQETIRKQQETIFKKSRMAELGEVAGGIAHEINNPLTVILANSQKIKRQISKENFTIEEIENMAFKIEKTSIRVSKIIEGLKNYSRDASNDPLENVNLQNLLEEINEIYAEKVHQKEILFKINDETNGAIVRGRSVQIYQVIVNLVNNAIDAIDENENREIEILCTQDEGIVRISVIDNGDGIPSNIEEKVFQPFFTTKPLGQGTGLGLSISYTIMEEMGGRLEIDRRFGDSRISLIFPNLS